MFRIAEAGSGPDRALSGPTGGGASGRRKAEGGRAGACHVALALAPPRGATAGGLGGGGDGDGDGDGGQLSIIAQDDG